MTISFNEREKEILVDVLEAHLESLDGYIDDGHEEFKEERDDVEALLNKVREA